MTLLTELPSEVLSHIFGQFSEGKALSTFFYITQTNWALHEIGFEIVRDALVVHYESIQRRVTRPQLLDVFQVLKEDVRTCSVHNNGRKTKIPSWCAILDYFVAMICFNDSNLKHFIVWCGPVETEYGLVESYATSPFWDVDLLLEWYYDLELSHLQLVRPRMRHGSLNELSQAHPFGTLATIGTADRAVMKLVSESIRIPEAFANDGGASYWNFLTPVQEAYEEMPAIRFTDHLYRWRGLPDPQFPVNYQKPTWMPSEESLCFFYRSGNGYDWDEAISALGEHVIRIMTRFVERKRESGDLIDSGDSILESSSRRKKPKPRNPSFACVWRSEVNRLGDNRDRPLGVTAFLREEDTMSPESLEAAATTLSQRALH